MGLQLAQGDEDRPDRGGAGALPAKLARGVGWQAKRRAPCPNERSASRPLHGSAELWRVGAGTDRNRIGIERLIDREPAVAADRL